jgi:hypothetical protein
VDFGPPNIDYFYYAGDRRQPLAAPSLHSKNRMVWWGEGGGSGDGHEYVTIFIGPEQQYNKELNGSRQIGPLRSRLWKRGVETQREIP